MKRQKAKLHLTNSLDQIDGLPVMDKLPRTEFEASKRSRLLNIQREKFFGVPSQSSDVLRCESESTIFRSADLLPNEEPDKIFDSLFKARSRRAIYASTPTLVDFRWKI